MWLTRLGLAALFVAGMFASVTAKPLRVEGESEAEIELTIELGEDAESLGSHPPVVRLSRSAMVPGRGLSGRASRHMRPPSRLPSTAPIPPPRRPRLRRSPPSGDDDDEQAIG